MDIIIFLLGLFWQIDYCQAFPVLFSSKNHIEHENYCKIVILSEKQIIVVFKTGT